MKEHYLLGEVSRVLGRKPHQIVHLLTTGKIPEPQQRIANKRLFSAEDVEQTGSPFQGEPELVSGRGDPLEHGKLRHPKV